MNLNAILRRCTKLCLFAALVAPLAAQEDDFNDGNDTGWTRFAPLNPFGGTAFSNNGGSYQISCQPSPDPVSYGPSRAAGLRQDRSYDNFCVMVDILDWNPAENSALGILARVQSGPGQGNVNGYAFTWQSKDNDVQISRITGEQAADISGNPKVTLTPGQSYRMVFTGVDYRLEGRIYHHGDLTTPIIVATAQDSTYEGGTCGLLIFSYENTRCSGTFDNYFANDGTPPPIQATLAENGGMVVSWNTLAGLGAGIEYSPDLSTWAPASGTATLSGERTLFKVTSAEGMDFAYCRLRTGTTQ